MEYPTSVHSTQNATGVAQPARDKVTPLEPVYDYG